MFNKLPTFIFINKNKYFINTNFRNMISFENQMQSIDDNTTNKDKTEVIFNALYRFCPSFFYEEKTEKEILKLHNKFLWFYKCGRENYHSSSGETKITNEIASFKYDDEYIFGAFLEQYDIDLSSIKYLHWWKFKACLKSLKKDTRIEEIKSYRAYSGKDEDMLTLRRYWTLPLKTKEQKQLDETADWLMKYNKK